MSNLAFPPFPCTCKLNHGITLSELTEALQNLCRVEAPVLCVHGVAKREYYSRRRGPVADWLVEFGSIHNPSMIDPTVEEAVKCIAGKIQGTIEFTTSSLVRVSVSTTSKCNNCGV